MSSFGAKRKARRIAVQDDHEVPAEPERTDTTGDINDGPALKATFKTRPFKQSSLRQSINLVDEEDDDDGHLGTAVRPGPRSGPRATSSKVKNQPSNSRLSFGATVEEPGADGDDMLMLGHDRPTSTTKKTSLAAVAGGKSAYKKGIHKNNQLPLRSMDADDDRPRYSREYLSELQKSTPNTPANIGSLYSSEEDMDLSLDPSELEGATVVATTNSPAAEPAPITVLTETEIREKKERRARLAQQAEAGDFISLSDDERGAGDSYLSVLSKRQPSSNVISQKQEKRLATDDNLDEDDSFFVEDGKLSLGAKAEREARRNKRSEMASMIAVAEGVEGDESSDDSEAERRAAYEAAQTRAGMDGLGEERESQKHRLGIDSSVIQVPPKITPLPDLSVLVEEFKAKISRKRDDLRRMRTTIETLTREREGIEEREPEVQKLLDEAGERYRGLMGGNGEARGDGVVEAAKSLLDQAKGIDTPGRGLEDFGATPVQAGTGDIEMD